MRKNKIIFWIATILIFLFEGVMPLSAWIFAPETVAAGCVALGYPEYFAYTLVVFKILGSIILIIPKLPRPLKEWAYAGFGFDFIFAMISHIAVDGALGVSFFPLIPLAVLIVSYIYYFKSYRNGQNSF